MVIKYFLLIFIFLLQISSATANYISYGDFVGLKKSEQIKTIRLVHKYLIEFENQSVLRQKKTKKYHTYKKIMNFFMDSAYGALPSTGSFNQHKCYYAGWVSFSKVDEATGNTYCVHPRRITLQDNINYLKSLGDPAILDFFQNQVSKKYQKYFGGQSPGSTPVKHIKINNQGKVTLTDGNDNCSRGESIACNPEVYGTHKVAGKEVSLCVKVSSQGNYGLNASFACDQAIQHLSKTQEEIFLEHMDSVIDPIIASNGQDTAPVELLKTMYDTCLCKGDRGLSNKAYSQKIFPTRTCTGVLSQTQNIYEAIKRKCEANPGSINEANMPLIRFLEKANLVLNDEMEKMRNIPFPDKHNRSAHRNKIEDYFKQDKAEYQELAEKNYAAAKAAGLCPIGTDVPEVVAPEPAHTPEEQPDESSFSVTPDGYLFAGKKVWIPLKMKAVIDGEIISDIKKEEVTFQPDPLNISSSDTHGFLTPPPKEEEKGYTGTFRDINSDEFTLKPLKFSCDITLNEEKNLATIKPNLKNIKGLEADKINKESLTSIELKQEGATATKKEDNPFEFVIENFKDNKPMSIKASVKLFEKDFPMECSLDETGEKKKAETFGSCKLSLKQVPQDDGTIKIESTMKYYKDKDGKEEVTKDTPEFSHLFKDPKLEHTFVWFDLASPRGNKSVDDKDVKEVADSDLNSLDGDEDEDSEDEDEDSEDEDEDSEDKDDEDEEDDDDDDDNDDTDKSVKAFNKLKKTFNVFRTKKKKVRTSSSIKNIQRLKIPRKITAMVQVYQEQEDEDGDIISNDRCGNRYLPASTTIQPDTTGNNGNAMQDRSPRQFVPGTRAKTLGGQK